MIISTIFRNRTTQKILRVVVPLAFWLGAWQLAAIWVDTVYTPGHGALLLPPPLLVWERLAALAARPSFWRTAAVSLGRIFGGAMGLKVHQELDGRYFPGKASVAISAPDRLRTGLFTPLFEGVEKLCNMCKILQHGKIHLYILYILATLVALLAWGLHA